MPQPSPANLPELPIQKPEGGQLLGGWREAPRRSKGQAAKFNPSGVEPGSGFWKADGGAGQASWALGHPIPPVTFTGWPLGRGQR